jgi:hypothetical protein
MVAIHVQAKKFRGCKNAPLKIIEGVVKSF